MQFVATLKQQVYGQRKEEVQIHKVHGSLNACATVTCITSMRHALKFVGCNLFKLDYLHDEPIMMVSRLQADNHTFPEFTHL